MLNFNDLSGWQRLWVVLSIIYLMPVAYVTYELLPRQAEIDRDHVNQTIEGAKFFDPDLKDQSASDIRESYKGLSDLQVAKRIQAQLKKKNPLQNVYVEEYFEAEDKYYHLQSQKLFREQAGCIGAGVLVWAIPIAFVYGIGWSVAWIRHGFKKT